jgi:S1-C subfamily serine protease
LRDFLQPNDVILKFAGSPVNRMDELFKTVEQADLSKELEMIIFRNQKENILKIPANTIK